MILNELVIATINSYICCPSTAIHLLETWETFYNMFVLRFFYLLDFDIDFVILDFTQNQVAYFINILN